MAKKRDIYVMSNGQPVTEGSVSELCGVLDKPALVPWAAKKTVEAVAEYWKPGTAYEQQYIELALQESKNAHRRAKDTAGDIGTRVHKIVGMYVDGQLKPEDVPDDRERRGLENFMKATAGWKWFGSEVVVVNEWLECGCGVHYKGREGDIECMFCGKPLRMCGYGGTTDGFAQLPSGMYVLPDNKTSNSVQAVYSMQCALYAKAKPIGEYAHLIPLWEKIEEARIIHFDKELLTWEVLERDIKAQFPFIPHFIGCRRWKKKFEQQSYSTYGDRKPVETATTFSIPSQATPEPVARPPAKQVWLG